MLPIRGPTKPTKAPLAPFSKMNQKKKANTFKEDLHLCSNK